MGRKAILTGALALWLGGLLIGASVGRMTADCPATAQPANVAPPALLVEAPAREVRLLGQCNGRFYAEMEESQFPATGCAWIEPIRFDTD